MRVGLGAKIAFAFAAPLAMVLACGFVSYRSLERLIAADTAARIGDVLEAAAVDSREMETELLLYAETGAERHLRSHASALERLRNRLSDVGHSIEGDPVQERRAAELQTLIARQAALARSTAGQRRDRFAQADRSVRAGGRQLGEEIRKRIAAMKSAETARLEQGRMFAAQNGRAALEGIRLGTLFAAISIGFAGAIIAFGILRPVRNLRRGLDKIREGDLAYRAGPARADQLGDLTESFNRMAESLWRAHGHLQYSSEVLRLILRNMADGVIVVDHAPKLILFNPAAEAILGSGPGDAPPDTWAERFGLHLADGRTICGPADMPLLAALNGRGVREVEMFVSNPLLRRPRWVSFSATPIADENGKLWGAVAVLTDNTERKQAQQALLESEEKFRAFVETTNEWIWSVDQGNSLTYTNPAITAVLGYLPQELRGRTAREFLHPEDCERFDEWLRQIGADRSGATGLVLRWVHRYGTYRWLESNAVPIVDASGAIRGYRGTSHDLTLRQMAEAEVQKLNGELRRRITQLNAANKELEAFSYSVSHDLRAPLRSIDGFSQALLEDYMDKLDEDGRDCLRRVRAATQRMAQLIDDLLNLSRVTRHEISRRTVDLTEIAGSVAGALREAQPHREARFSIAPELMADADPRLLRIVMENLLGNAWKFTRKAACARIEVGAVSENGHRAFYVKDNGVGFDMAYADKLFGAFQRLHAMDEFEGTGIGLATVQRIIHKHGGRVWAEAAVGEGATFFFTLN